jgi:hypothetical protein
MSWLGEPWSIVRASSVSYLTAQNTGSGFKEQPYA